MVRFIKSVKKKRWNSEWRLMTLQIFKRMVKRISIKAKYIRAYTIHYLSESQNVRSIRPSSAKKTTFSEAVA
jgi:hypothetical protein